MKESRIYKFKTNKNHWFKTDGSHRGGTVFWASLKKGTYRRGMETKSLLSKLNPFDRVRE